MRVLFFLSALALSVPAFSYDTNCSLKKDGWAVGSIKTKEPLSLAGKIHFRLYNRAYEELETKSDFEYRHITTGRTAVARVRVPSGTARCHFDVTEALDGKQPDNPTLPPPSDRPFAFCEIVGGKAEGWARTAKYEPLTLIGDITFTFFKRDEKKHIVEIGKQSLRVVESLYDGAEKLAEVPAKREAWWCTLDITNAIVP